MCIYTSRRKGPRGAENSAARPADKLYALSGEMTGHGRPGWVNTSSQWTLPRSTLDGAPGGGGAAVLGNTSDLKTNYQVSKLGFKAFGRLVRGGGKPPTSSAGM